jgi:hypothetical protein
MGKIMKLKFALLGVISILLFVSCSEQQGESYFPESSKGSQWEYSIEYTTPFAGIQKGKVLTRVDEEVVIDGKSYFKYVTVFSGIPGAKSEINYYRRAKDGIYKTSDKDIPEYLVTPFPLTVGKTWTVKDSNNEIEYRVDRIETAELFDKKFDNCLKITFEGTIKKTEGSLNIKGYIYKAEGIGDVKSSTVIEGRNKVIMDMELVKHEK